MLFSYFLVWLLTKNNIQLRIERTSRGQIFVLFSTTKTNNKKTIVSLYAIKYLQHRMTSMGIVMCSQKMKF